MCISVLALHHDIVLFSQNRAEIEVMDQVLAEPCGLNLRFPIFMVLHRRMDEQQPKQIADGQVEHHKPQYVVRAAAGLALMATIMIIRAILRTHFQAML